MAGPTSYTSSLSPVPSCQKSFLTNTIPQSTPYIFSTQWLFSLEHFHILHQLKLMHILSLSMPLSVYCLANRFLPFLPPWCPTSRSLFLRPQHLSLCLTPHLLLLLPTFFMPLAAFLISSLNSTQHCSFFIYHHFLCWYPGKHAIYTRANMLYIYNLFSKYGK